MNEIQSIQKPHADPAVLAVEIRSLQQQARVVVMSYAVEIGRRLCEAKSVVPHGEWGDWLEKKVQFSQSTAQNYMKMYERFGSEQVSLFSDPKSEALMNLPYTKALKLLAVPEEEMDDFMEAHDVEAMTTRELEKAIKERDEARRQTEQWKNSADQAADGALRAEETARKAKAEAEVLRRQLEELQNRPVEVAVEAPSEEMLREIRAAEAKKFQEEREALEKKLTSAEKKAEKASKEAEGLRSKVEAAKTEAKKELQGDIEKAEAERAAMATEKAAAEAENAELHRKLKTADGSAAVFQVYFTAVQEDCNRMLGIIKKAEPQQGEKFRNAMKALLENIGRMVEA